MDMPDEEESGETGEEEGGEEQPAEDKTAPTATVTASVSGTTISYEFVITDETALGNNAELRLLKKDWTEVQKSQVTLQLNADGKSATVAGEFENVESGNYIVDLKTWDAAGNEGYFNTNDNIELTVQ